MTKWTKQDIVRAFTEIKDFRGRCNYLDDTGWELLGEGAWKTVYGHDEADFVVKLQKSFSVKCKEGMEEVENSMTAPLEIAVYLVPVDQHDEYQLQHRVHTGCTCKESGCPGFITGMADSPGGINHGHESDGTLVIWDYGQSRQWYYLLVEQGAA